MVSQARYAALRHRRGNPDTRFAVTYTYCSTLSTLPGFAVLLTERRAVVSSRGASVQLWGRVDSRGKIGRRYGNLGFRSGR